MVGKYLEIQHKIRLRLKHEMLLCGSLSFIIIPFEGGCFPAESRFPITVRFLWFLRFVPVLPEMGFQASR